MDGTTTAGGGVTGALLTEISHAFNSRDADRIMSYFAEDCTFFMASGPEPVGRTVHGKAAVHKVLADRFKVIPDMHWAREYEYACGDRAVTVWPKDTYWKIVRPD